MGLLSAILLVVSLATINTTASRITLGAWGLSLLFALLAAVPTGLISRRSLGRRLSMMLAGWRTPESVVACAIILIGAVMRLYDLAGIPSGIHGDETGEALITLSVLEGKGPNPFGTAFYGDRALYFYLHAPFFIVFGKTLTAVRIFSALAGVATLPAFYLLMRRLFGIRPALIALALLAGSAVHINYSRLGLNVVQISLFTIVTLYCLRLGQESRRPFWWLSTGILAGLTVYFSFGGILVSVTVALYFLYLFITRHSNWRAWATGAVFCAIGVAMTILPAAVFTLGQNDLYAEHAASRLIFGNWEWIAATHRTSSWWGVLVGQLKANLLFFFSGHDFGPFYVFTGAPMLAAALGPFVALGLALMLVRSRDDRYGLLALWFWTVVLFGGVLTINSPQSHRLLPAALAAIAGAALVLDWIVVAGSQLLPRRAAPALLALAVAVPTLAAYADNSNYFGPALASKPWAMETQQGYYFATLGPGYRGYTLAAPRLPFDSSVTRFLAPGVEGDSLTNPGLRLPLSVPPDRDLAFVVYPFMSHYLPLLHSLYPSAVVEKVRGGSGQVAFTSVRVPATEVARSQGLIARYGDVTRVEQDASALGEGAARYPAEATWSGSIYVERDGSYLFRIGGPASSLLIDGALTGVDRPLHLWKGWHPLEVKGQLPEAGSRVALEWAPPDQPLSEVPSHLLDARNLSGSLRGLSPIEGGRAAERLDRTIGFRDLGQLFLGQGPLSARWEGTLHAPAEGLYGFSLRSNGRAEITIDGGTAVSNNGESWEKPTTATLPLAAGPHSFTVHYDGRRDGGLLEVLWTVPGGSTGLIPPEAFAPPAQQHNKGNPW